MRAQRRTEDGRWKPTDSPTGGTKSFVSWTRLEEALKGRCTVRLSDNEFISQVQPAEDGVLITIEKVVDPTS